MRRARRSRLAEKHAGEGIVLVLPLMAGSAVFYAVPFLRVLRNSVHNGIGLSERFVGLENYVSMLGNGIFRLAFGNTLKFLAIALPLIIALSFAIALLLKSQAQQHGGLKSVLLLPHIMPVVGTVMLVELLFAENGMINAALDFLGLPVTQWLESGWAFWVVLLLYLWKNAGYSVILLLSGLITIPGDQYEAADLDGATGWQRLWHITVPQMWYSVFFATVFSLINAFKCFREIFLIGGVHPHTGIYMLQHFINNAFDKLNYPKLAVASVLLFTVLTVLFAVSYQWVMKKEAYRE